MQQRRRRKEDLILDHFTALTNAEISRFLKRYKITGASANAKDELRGVLRQALTAKQITADAVVRFLDEVTPWGKQHVYLYNGPSTKDWRNETWVRSHLTHHKLVDLLDSKSNTIVLPDQLQLASILWNKRSLRIVAVRKREGWVRNEEFDNTRKTTPDGRPLWLKGFVFQVLRGITAFEWNLVSNEAFLQVTQLPTGGNYDQVANEFKREVEPWLDIGTFQLVDLRLAVKKLLELEEQGKGTAQSHSLDYKRLGQRRISIRSTSTKVPLVGDKVLDGVMKTVRRDGIPRIGDFFFLDGSAVSAGDGKAASKQHVIIMAEQHRINFATPSTENGVRNVLTSLRKLGN